MANSRFEYVKLSETPNILTPGCWLVVRVDGHAFHKFTAAHDFAKPNDEPALQLMNRAAKAVMSKFSDITLAYGNSDEFSFLFRPRYDLYGRRESKLLSTLVSVFTAAYTFHWSEFIQTKMKYPAAFDGRVVCYPTTLMVRDYFRWRQADAHINNLYNTTFWALVQSAAKDGTPKLTTQEAEERLRFTVSAQKNELLWNQYDINYNNENAMFKKGSILLYETEAGQNDKKRKKAGVSVLHIDLIQDTFWDKYPNILDS